MLRSSALVSISTVILLGAASGSARATGPTAVRAEAPLASGDAADEPDHELEEPARYAHEPPERSRFQLGLGIGFTLGLGDVLEGRGDVVGNGGSPMFLDLSIAPSYRFAPDFALGVRAGVGLEPGSRDERSSSGETVEVARRLWHASAMGRYQAEAGRGLYVMLSLGAASIVDSRGNSSTSQWAPLLGATAGYDLRLAEPVALGLELRAAYAEFGEGSYTSPAGFYDYQVSTWLGAGVVGSILP